ncbi:MAG TPA: PLP-dependent cysteine synthase family protein [Thermoanaerobaculia bacterium]|nr:PLP-dependent cysteine synthase family protein [Thermoanaerobaculia bacterium]
MNQLATALAPSPVDAIEALIGNTPLLEIRYRHRRREGRIYAKYELENMTGSVKDRMAAHIIRRGYETGVLRPGDLICEASSGNTGIAMAAIGRALGHPVRIYLPDWMSPERAQLIRTFGAEVVPVSHQAGGFVGAVELAARWGEEHDHVFLSQQFDNPVNVEAHELTTGPELEQQLAHFGRRADAFVAGVGTGGTVMGVGRFLRRRGRRVAVHPLEPSNSPTLRTGVRCGEHRIQGISDEFVPRICHLDELDSIVDVWDGDAILMAQKLCRELGLAVGISSGANVLGAIQVAAGLAAGANVATILPDSNKKYLSTDLFHEEPVRAGYLTPEVELLGFVATR